MTATITGNQDIPFAVIYLVDPVTGTATIASTTFSDDVLPSYLADMPRRVSPSPSGNTTQQYDGVVKPRWPIMQVVDSGEPVVTQFEETTSTKEEKEEQGKGISSGMVV